MPVYFSQEPALSARGSGASAGRGGPAVPGVGADVTPNAVPIQLSPYEKDDAIVEPKGLPTQAADAGAVQRAVGSANAEENAPPPRVVMQFPTKADEMLLSGELAGGQSLSGRALAIDQPLGQGHVVMFALRPFWRWQTQGTYALGFNTIVNWDHLDAGKTEKKAKAAEGTGEDEN